MLAIADDLRSPLPQLSVDGAQLLSGSYHYPNSTATSTTSWSQFHSRRYFLLMISIYISALKLECQDGYVKSYLFSVI